MTLSTDAARARIREAGLRATAPRVAVVCLLTSHNTPLSHSQVVAALGDDAWDQATLYRNLVKLTEAGLTRVASRVDGIARYELRAHDDGPHLHPHFSCRVCGAVMCLPDAQLTGPVDQAWHRAISEAELQLLGTCPACMPR